MIYLMYGLESYLMKQEVINILKKENIDVLNQSNYDLENTDLKDIIEDAATIYLFGDKKAILVDNN